MQALDLAGLANPAGDGAALLRPEGPPVRYGELRRLVLAGQRQLEWPAKALVVVDAPRTITGVVAYLSALRAGHAVMLAEQGSAQLWHDVITAYRPELLVCSPGSTLAGIAEPLGFRPCPGRGLPRWRQAARSDPTTGRPARRIHPSLAMLIRTSGSAGTPKTARLSYENLRSNAIAIAQALRIHSAEVALSSLPLDFSFGLSILNSHLAAGAATALTTAAPSSAELWWCADRMRATCVGAVPATFHFLRARRWEPREHPSLRRLLQAGGALDTASIRHFATLMKTAGGEFVTMYGQTEATARIAYLPPELLNERLGSVGIAIPGGHLRIERADGGTAAEGEVGEVVYQGPNVMMGYARTRTDLAAGDERHGILHTGDLGSLRDGFLYLNGRADRQVKVLGRRIDLTQVELSLAGEGVDAAVIADGGHRVVVAVEPPGASLAAAQCRALAAHLGLPHSSLTVTVVPAVPRTSRGKVDYVALRQAVGQGPGPSHATIAPTKGSHENQLAVLRQP